MRWTNIWYQVTIFHQINYNSFALELINNLYERKVEIIFIHDFLSPNFFSNTPIIELFKEFAYVEYFMQVIVLTMQVVIVCTHVFDIDKVGSEIYVYTIDSLYKYLDFEIYIYNNINAS